jgi:hypothetical protein
VTSPGNKKKEIKIMKENKYDCMGNLVGIEKEGIFYSRNIYEEQCGEWYNHETNEQGMFINNEFVPCNIIILTSCIDDLEKLFKDFFDYTDTKPFLPRR